jgi:hypothetical protein
MKKFYQLNLIIYLIIASCQSQEKNTLEFNYNAQTRGYLLVINLKGHSLVVNKNGEIEKVKLSKKQLQKINNIVSELNFKELKNSISIDDLAVDKAIKGEFKLSFKKTNYLFEFDHNNLPIKIQLLIDKILSFQPL